MIWALFIVGLLIVILATAFCFIPQSVGNVWLMLIGAGLMVAAAVLRFLGAA